MISLTCALVGDTGSGKTCSVISYTTNAFPCSGEYIPSCDQTCNVMMDGRPISLRLLDLDGDIAAQDADKQRFIPGISVFLICFDITNRESFRNAAGKWTNEIRKYNSETNQNVPYLLIGCKSELRDSQYQHDLSVSLAEDPANVLVRGYCRALLNADVIGECFRFYFDPSPISVQQGIAKADEIGAQCYLGHSALTQNNMKSVYDEAIRAALVYKHKLEKSKQSKRCVLM